MHLDSQVLEYFQQAIKRYRKLQYFEMTQLKQINQVPKTSLVEMMCGNFNYLVTSMNVKELYHDDCFKFNQITTYGKGDPQIIMCKGQNVILK